MKKLKYLTFAFLSFFTLKLYPLAANAKLGFCQESGVKRVFQILGYALYILKIAVPILLIIYGIIDFSKAIVASDQDAIKKSTQQLAKRAIAGVVIFLIPTIIWYAFNVVQRTLNNDNRDYSNLPEYNTCVKCMTKPGQCNP